MFAATLVQAQHADIIITNGKISTLDNDNTEVQAVAIRGNKIVQTGTNADVLKLKGAGTKIIDAKGNRVIPGLFDTHMHVIRGGRFYNAELRWDGVTSLKRALQMLKEQAERTPEGQWVRVVGGWNEYQFEAMDIIAGRMCPDLGGDESFLEILGFNYYWNCQWRGNADSEQGALSR